MFKMSDMLKDSNVKNKHSGVAIKVFEDLEKRAKKSGVEWPEQLRNESPEMADILVKMIESARDNANKQKIA